MNSPLWTVRGRAFAPAPAEDSLRGRIAPHVVWGIVNVTPDSFYDGGSHPTPETGLAHARLLVEDGAGILDVGGASSRPGSEDVSPEEEIRRVLPVVRALVDSAGKGNGGGGTGTEILVSVDTWRAPVAAAVLEAGAHIVNDISACAWEPELLEVVAAYKPGYVLMHCQGRPGTMQRAPVYTDVVDEVRAFFEQTMNRMVSAGLPEECVIVDPGIGFGKTLEHNLALLANLDSFQALGRPILLGISNKSLFGELFGLPAAERRESTNVCTALAAGKGIVHHRVHDVAGAWRALRLARAMGTC